MTEANDWQTWAALAVVALTIVAFAVRKKRSKSKGCSSCDKDSGCS